MPRSGNIYYSEYPLGQSDLPALILIHGAGGSSDSWPLQLRRLRGFRVLAIDLPAHGKSNGLPETNIGGYAARLMEWMQTIELGHVVLVGHSMGAAIALSMALQSPEITRLVLLAGAGQFLVNPVLMEKFSIPGQTQQAIKMIVTWSFARAAGQPLRKALSEQLRSNQPGVLRQDFLACSSFDLAVSAKEIRLPTLLLCGQNDVMVPLQRTQELGKHLVRGTLQVIRGAGHMLMQENPLDVAAAIQLSLGKGV